MQYMHSSRPVSGVEHLFSHVWEMETLSSGGATPAATHIAPHGHKVAIGTLAATAFTEIFFKSETAPTPSSLYKRPTLSERRAEVERAFAGSPAHDKIVEAAVAKFMDDRKVALINEAFRDTWKETRRRVLERLLPYAELRGLLEKAGCPVRPEEIGFSRNGTIGTALVAQMIRNKYSILDLAWDMGNLTDVLKEMELGNYLY
jgi:glycerol-1-phosphate dehydrogenase [NAD(P)+]